MKLRIFAGTKFSVEPERGGSTGTDINYTHYKTETYTADRLKELQEKIQEQPVLLYSDVLSAQSKDEARVVGATKSAHYDEEYQFLDIVFERKKNGSATLMEILVNNNKFDIVPVNGAFSMRDKGL